MAIPTDRTELSEAPNNGDFLHIVDVSDTTDNAAGTSKKITISNLLSGLASIYAALSHTHTASEVTDFDTEVANNSAVTANTAKNSYPSGDASKLAGIAAGAEVNPDVVSQIEAETGTATTERTWTAQRVAQAIAALETGGGSALEVEDEGSSLSTSVSKINFVGSGVTATEPTADEITVTIAGGAAPVDSVNTQTGAVVLDADDIDDTSTTNKFATAAELSKLSGIEALADVTDATNVAAAIDLTLTENTDGFEISGGSSSSRTLTVTSGDVTLAGGTAAKGDILVGDAGNDFDAVPVGSDDQMIVADSGQTRGVKYVDLDVSVQATIDGGGSALSPGDQFVINSIPADFTIEKVTITGDVSGSCVVDIWKDTYANFPATDADSITASAQPTLSSAQKNQDLSLTGWTTAVSAGDHLVFNVDSATTITRVTVTLEGRRTF